MERFCLDCKASLKGRSDKKFCDDLCRSNYHNQLKAGERNHINATNQILQKNRRILMAVNPTGKAWIKRDFLLQNGFNFNFHTRSYTSTRGSTYFFCYEYGYLLLENDEVLIVKWKEK